MEERKWEDLEMDCLLNVLERVGMESLLLGVPFVCKSWHKVSLDPFCWRCLEFPFAFDSRSYKSFINRFKDAYGINHLMDTAFIKFIIDRSRGTATKLVLPNCCTEEDLKYAADQCPALEILGFPSHLYCQRLSIIAGIIAKWKNLEGLILGIPTVLKDHELIALRDAIAYIGVEEIATLVSLLPRIKYLDLSWTWIDMESLIMILGGCKELLYLDVSNCENFYVDKQILELASHIPKFKYEGSRVLALTATMFDMHVSMYRPFLQFPPGVGLKDNVWEMIQDGHGFSYDADEG